MRVKEISLSIFIVTMCACAPKTYPSTDVIIKETKGYVEKTNANRNLEESFDEGALTDVSGNEDIGYFKYYTYHDRESNELIRIKNIETTDNTVAENFYFKASKLVFINVKTDREPVKEMYIINGKVVNKTTVNSKYMEVLLNKAKLFQSEFNKRD